VSRARTVIGPQGGVGSPQWQFLTTTADFAVFNGQPGSGKSAALTLDLLRGTSLPLYRAAAFRRKAKQLTQSGGLWDLAKRWYPQAGAQCIASPHLECRFPSGAVIQYHHLNTEGEKEGHDGASYEALAFDELPHFTEQQFWYLAGSRNRGVSGYRPTVRASTMATPDSWVHRIVAPWLDAEGAWPRWEMSGVLKWFARNPFDDQLVWFDSSADASTYRRMVCADAHPDDPIRKIKPKSFTVIHARTADNEIMLASASDYESSLGNMTRYERERLAGNWNARPPSAGMFDRRFFRVLDERPRDEEIVFSVRGWDRASSIASADGNPDPDWTRGVRLDKLRTGQVAISDVVSLRDRPGQVNQLMMRTAELDGPMCTQAMWINPGDSGIYEQEDLQKLLRAVPGCGPLVFRRQVQNKEAYARPCASFFDPDVAGVQLGAIVRAPWNGECLAEAEMFPLKKHPVTDDDLHDDFVDALSRAYIEIGERNTGKRGNLSDWAGARLGGSHVAAR